MDRITYSFFFSDIKRKNRVSQNSYETEVCEWKCETAVERIGGGK